MIYDLIILGAGPAGMTAGIYAAMHKMKFLIISMDVGGQMGWSSEVDNYPGVPDESGIALVQKFQRHMKEHKIKIKREEVLKLEKKKNLCLVKTNKHVYESKAVVIATGKKPRKLGVPGEEKYAGSGVSYCAAFDAHLYKDKTCAVVGGGNSGMDAALFLSKYAKKVYIMESLPQLGGELYLREKIMNNKKITVIAGAKIKEIFGNDSIKGMKYEQAGQIKELEIDGIFVEIGLMCQYEFTDVQKNKWGEIMIYRSTITHEENMTDVPGVFAAGDCTDIPSKQIIVAAGEGAKAALAAFNYINKWK